MQFFSEYLALCGAMSPVGKLVLAADLSIALAYIAIPVGLLLVWRYRVEDLPYPWMFCLFGAFILACSLTHLVHAIQMPWTTFEHTVEEAAVDTVCALLLIGTAIALLAVMPRALRMISPTQRRLELEARIEESTRENRELLREINHRLGNQLQVMSSAVKIALRRTGQGSDTEALRRIERVIEGFARDYREASERYGPTPEMTSFPVRSV